MYYNYHASNFKRIENGELIAVENSAEDQFAFILLFSSYPYTRPIRPHSVHKYERFFALLPFRLFFKNAPKES